MDFSRHAPVAKVFLRSPNLVTSGRRVKRTEALLESNFGRNRSVDRAPKASVGRRWQRRRRLFLSCCKQTLWTREHASENPLPGCIATINPDGPKKSPPLIDPVNQRPHRASTHMTKSELIF